ncbi:hypothetical protein SUGI_0831030 [Cryptomeria japonica]|uniref:putative E3 ubiquitin-protein ligase LIN-1 n=1 Tax=Cryptomeria japonica TaxID=3369 RepID=UPI0024147BA0|nr:putative E3 ubiquitin-protein ligase LIN-1 [Cryptomeria japonica]GLJ40383.1 hypothetical protein SUGI_0831030 [Cryptomeria japonica]
MAGKAIMDSNNLGKVLTVTIASFLQDRLINREQRIQQKEQCAERLAAGEPGIGEVAYSEQAVLANLDWGIDALEEAITSSNEETKAARLQHAEKMLQVCAMLDAKQTTAGVPNFYLCAWSHLNLAFLWKLRNDDRNAVAQILEMFLVDPLFSRIDFAPELWESLFLPHLRSIVGWYTEQRQRIVLDYLPDSTDLSFSRDDHEYVFNDNLLSGLSPEQTQRLQELEKVYQESLDENTKLYTRYYKDWINFDPSVSKKGNQPLIPIAEPPMTPRHELSRLIPQSVKFGPVPPKSAGFSSVVGLSTGKGKTPTRYGSANGNTTSTDDGAEDLSTRMFMDEVNWEEERTNCHNTDNAYNADIEMDCKMDITKKVPAAYPGTRSNSKRVFSKNQTISEDKLVLANAYSPGSGRQSSNQQSMKRRDFKSRPLSELLEADTVSTYCTSPRNDYSSEDSEATSPDPEHNLEDANSYGDIPDDEDEVQKESELNDDYETQAAELEERSYSMPISSPLTESEEDISQNSFQVHSSGKSTPQRRPPKDFVCPITGQLFTDPVTLETGQTYERQAIQEWLDRGNTTCPITRQNLGSTALPNTNILLKRLISSWKEQNPELAMEFRFSETPRSHISNPIDLYSSRFLSSPDLNSSPNRNSNIDIAEVKTRRSFMRRSASVSSSPTSVISQATFERTMSELSPSISHLCTSQDLQECQAAVLKISKVWQGCKANPIIQSQLTKPAMINSFFEILSNSFDAQALKATVYILSELVSVDNIVSQTLMRVDPDYECLASIIRKGLAEAAVLLYQLKPSSSQLSFHDLVPSLVHIIISNIEESELQFPMSFQSKEVATVMLESMLNDGDESCRSLNAQTVISMNALPALVESLECKSLQVRYSAVSILLSCIRGDGICRNLIAQRAELAPVLELFHTGNDGERSVSIAFISELVRLNRRTFNNQALQIIKDEGTFSTMHMLLVYLQMASMEQRLIVASLLLQMDLLAEPRKMSMYREEAIEALVEGLKAKEFLMSQIAAAETIVALSGRLSLSGKPLTEAWLLRTAGFDKNYDSLTKAEKPLNEEDESTEFLKEDEEAAKVWERKVAFVLVNYEFGALFEALGKCLRNNSVELARPCLVAATWLTYMLKVLPDTGVQGVARRCLLQHFAMVLQSSRILEERILAMLALSTFINDSEALKDLGTYVKGICKPLRQLKKSSTVAADILRALVNLPSVNISKLCSFTESALADSSLNGEIRSLVHCGGQIISGHSDGTLKVWDGRKRLLQLIQEAREHTKSITCLSVSSSREKIYSGSLDKSVRVWAIGAQEIKCIQVLDMKDPVQALVVSGNVACFIAQGTGVKIHNLSGSIKLLNPNKNVKCLAIGNGKVYCGCTDYTLQEMDLKSSTTNILHQGARTLLGQKPIYGLQLLDNHLYACGVFLDGVVVKVWNLSNNNVIGTISTTLEIRCIAVSNEFIFLGSKTGIIEVWLRERLVKVGSLNSDRGGNNNRVICLVVDKEGDVLFSGSQDGKIQAWSLT